MSRLSYNSAVCSAVREHLFNFFDNGQEGFIEEVKYQMKNHVFGMGLTAYNVIANMAKNGFFLCYTNDMRKFIQEIFNQSDDEAKKYSDDKVFDLYVHLVARDGAKLIK